MRAQLPKFDQVLELPALVEGTVTPDYIDANGHMNVKHYLEHDTEAVDVLCRSVQIDDNYRSERGLGVFTVEHHLRYFSELHLGDKFSVHTRVIGRNEKAVHALSLLLDRTHDRLANTLELLLVHVSLQTRRAEPIPVDIAAGLDTHITASDELSWPAPLCGAMGLRA